jgi:hypothetical protein
LVFLFPFGHDDVIVAPAGSREPPMIDRITIRKLDDWHLQVRDLEVMPVSLPYRALIYRGGETLAWQVTDVS